ncbi:MAG: hypothetical protein RMN52_02280 [Anaerolineae bacterium]|nr:hypothetical protein [Candidatus Roseilinea sp.]MDW8448808.1 hypothetical protein [Anaerolineae bacterium]
MNLVKRLIQFRQDCEKQAGVPATEIEVSVGHVLDDVCRVLKLSPKQRRQVLGRRASAQLRRSRQERVDLNPAVSSPKDPPA